MALKTNYTKKGNNYYRATAVIAKDGSGNPIRKEFYGKSKSDAESKKNEYLKNLEMGLELDYKEKVLRDLMRTWLFEVVRVASKPATFERYESIYRNYIKNDPSTKDEPSPLFNLNVYDIRPIQIQRYYNDLYANNKSSSVIRNLNKFLKTFFNYAYEEGYILKNPCIGKKIVIPRNSEVNEDSEESREFFIFTEEEIKSFQKAIEKNRIRALFILALATGLRRGELLGLKWSDINFDSKELKVQRSVKRVTLINEKEEREGKIIVQLPKTKTSIRTVPIPSSVIPILEKHKIQQNKERLKLGDSYLNNDGYVFTTESGNLIDPRNLLRAYMRALKSGGIMYRKFHNLRHTYATRLFEEDVPLKTVQELLGHSDLSVTSNIYTHVMPAKKNDAAEKLNKLFS